MESIRSHADVSGPLSGVRVLDLTAMLAGPFATMVLADLGADVVKIEPPHGDISRTVGPWRQGEESTSLGAYFQSVNRGKRSIVLNLKVEGDREAFFELVRNADVLAENYSAGVMDRLGLSYETLREINPRLVYAAIRGFGDDRTGVSPYRDWPAVDVIAQAMSGFLSITGTADGAPIKSGPGIGDLIPGLFMTIGITAALRHAELTGEGQFLDVAMYDAMLAVCERIVYQHSVTGEVPVPQGNSHPWYVPFDIMPTKDGWVAIAAAHESHWRTLVEVIGRPELAHHPAFAGIPARSERRAEILKMLDEWLSTRTTAEVIDALGGRIPIGPVNTAADIYADPHAAARGMLVEVGQPGDGTPITLAGCPIKLTATASSVAGRAPVLGEHTTEEVLQHWRR